MKNKRNKLKDYMYFNDMTSKVLGGMIGYAPNTISKYIAGKARISPRVAKAVSAAINGKITVEQLIADNMQKVKKEPSGKRKRRLNKNGVC